MESIRKSIEVDAPIGTVYNQWTQFEEFPKFMEGVKEVRQLSPKRLYWRAEVFGQEKEWEAEIDDQTPDRRIAWHSSAGTATAGSVEFEPLEGKEGERTRVILGLSFQPESTLERMGETVLAPKIQADLERFKQYVETHRKEVTGWRGQVEYGRVKNYS